MPKSYPAKTNFTINLDNYKNNSLIKKESSKRKGPFPIQKIKNKKPKMALLKRIKRYLIMKQKLSDRIK